MRQSSTLPVSPAGFTHSPPALGHDVRVRTRADQAIASPHAGHELIIRRNDDSRDFVMLTTCLNHVLERISDGRVRGLVVYCFPHPQSQVAHPYVQGVYAR